MPQLCPLRPHFRIFAPLHISQINMADSAFGRHLTRPNQRPDGSRVQFAHAVLRKETGKMQRILSKAMSRKPTAHAPYHFHVIVHARNQQVGYLNPHPCLLHQFQRTEDGCERSAADRFVQIVRKRFQVDIRCAHIRQQILQRRFVYIACRDQNVLQPGFAAGAGTVAGILKYVSGSVYV